MSNPVQAWIDYLLSEIAKDIDPVVRSTYKEVVALRGRFLAGDITEDQLRVEFNIIRDEILPICAVKHHTQKLMDATIEYIIEPNKKLQLQ
jgi:hypothetical protein